MATDTITDSDSRAVQERMAYRMIMNRAGDREARKHGERAILARAKSPQAFDRGLEEFYERFPEARGEDTRDLMSLVSRAREHGKNAGYVEGREITEFKLNIGTPEQNKAATDLLDGRENLERSHVLLDGMTEPRGITAAFERRHQNNLRRKHEQYDKRSEELKRKASEPGVDKEKLDRERNLLAVQFTSLKYAELYQNRELCDKLMGSLVEKYSHDPNHATFLLGNFLTMAPGRIRQQFSREYGNNKPLAESLARHNKWLQTPVSAKAA